MRKYRLRAIEVEKDEEVSSTVAPIVADCARNKLDFQTIKSSEWVGVGDGGGGVRGGAIAG